MSASLVIGLRCCGSGCHVWSVSYGVAYVMFQIPFFMFHGVGMNHDAFIQRIVAHWRHMATWIWVNIDSGGD